MMGKTETAITLMKMAMALLDNEGEYEAAARLQHAISAADREPIPKTIEEVEELLNRPEVRALVERFSLTAANAVVQQPPLVDPFQ